MEFSEKQFIQLIERLTTLESKVDNLTKNTDDTNRRLSEIEKSYNKSLGAIWVAVSIAGVAITMILTMAQLWIDKQITEYHQSHPTQK